MTVQDARLTRFVQTIGRIARSAAIGFAMSTFGFAAVASASDVKKPDCATLESWAQTIDGKDRVAPVEGSRAWVPKAFLAPEFADLFGVPALEWSEADAKAVGAHVYACGKAAAKARKTAARNALYEARSYMVGNLRGVLAHAEQKRLADQRAAERAARQAEREKARAKLQADRAAAQAAERERLAARQQAERQRMEAQRQAERERYAARQKADTQRRQSAARPQPATPARPAATQDAVAGKELAADYRKKIAGAEATAEGLQALTRWEREIRWKVAKAAGKAEADKLLALASEKRRPIEKAVVASVKRNIDEAGNKADSDRAALQEIDNLAANAAGTGMSVERLKEVRAYARERQVPYADRELAAAAKKLDDYPETLKGLDSLQRAVHIQRSQVMPRASEPAQKAYLQAARARLTDVAEEVLPEFKDALDGLPETSVGLYATEKTVVSQKGFQDVAANVRADYEAALKSRRAAIAKAIGAKVDEARDKAVAAGGDPDLVGYRFVDRAKGWQLGFKDEKHAVLASRRNQANAPYEVRGDEVVVKGPQISLVLKRSGRGAATKLEGLGFVFVRADR